MLNCLKRDLIVKENMTTVPELIMESMSNDDIRDAFLDNPELVLANAANDPKVEKEIESIPEFEEAQLTDDEMSELENLEESVEMIPEF